MSQISYEAYRQSVIHAGVKAGYDASTMKLSLGIEAKLRKIETHTDLAQDYAQLGNAAEVARHKRERSLLLADVIDTLHRFPTAKVAHELAKQRASL